MTPTPSRIPVIYIAGPFRAPTAWRVEQNIRRAEESALAIWRMGAAALCPHTNTRYFDGEANDEIWLEGDLEFLRRSDGVYMVDGWNRSTGAKAEHLEASRLELPIFYDTLVVEAWIRAWKEHRS